MSILRRWTDELTETQWDTLRALLLVVVLGGAGAGGYFLGLPAWRHWQNRRALAQAAAFAQQRDYRDLMLALRRATELAPGDMDSWRAVGQLLAEVGSPDTLVAREQLARLAPEDMALRLALAEDALRFGRIDTVESTLGSLDSAARRDVAFHRIAAALAMALGRTADLDRELQAILAAEPGNLDAQFTYAALRLWSPDPAASAAGEAELERLVGEPAFRVRAGVELLSSSSRLGGPAKVADILRLLLARFAPGAAPDFSAPTVPAWNPLIEGIKSAAAPSGPDVALVARWLSEIGRWPEALAWVDTLPPAVRNARLVADISAEICAEHDDARLPGLLRAGAWGEWPEGAQVLALAARVQQLHYGEDHARQTWTDAIAASADSVVGLRALARLASEWRYFGGEEAVLRRILEREPKAFWAYGALRTLYLQRGDLARLFDLYGAWGRQLPDDPSIVSAGIMLGAVLDHTDPSTLAQAAALRARFPGSLPAQVAHAAALWRMGRAADAWAILSTAPAAARLRPDVSFWVALIQADLGHRAEAAAAVARAQPGAVSREEKALLQEAAAKANL